MATQTQRTQVLELYTAYFNRAADKDGVDYWLNEMDNKNWTIDTVAQTFSQQKEYTDLYDGLSNSQVVNQVYTNVLNRTADDEGLEYWEGRLSDSENPIPVSQFIQAVTTAATEKDSTGNFKNPDDANLFNNKIEVSQYFYDKNVNDTTTSLDTVTADDSSIEKFKTIADNSNEETPIIENEEYNTVYDLAGHTLNLTYYTRDELATTGYLNLHDLSIRVDEIIEVDGNDSSVNLLDDGGWISITDDTNNLIDSTITSEETYDWEYLIFGKEDTYSNYFTIVGSIDNNGEFTGVIEESWSSEAGLLGVYYDYDGVVTGDLIL